VHANFISSGRYLDCAWDVPYSSYVSSTREYQCSPVNIEHAGKLILHNVNCIKNILRNESTLSWHFTLTYFSDCKGSTQKLVLLHETFVMGGPLLHSFSTLCKNFHINREVGINFDTWVALDMYSLCDSITDSQHDLCCVQCASL